MEIELRINGVIESLDAAPNETLLSLLRREGYSSVKHGCETGECGACTVLVDGVPRPGCVTLAAQVGGCTLTTADSVNMTDLLQPLQSAFVDVGAVQCGFCTPGMILSASALLKRTLAPTADEARNALSGNLCRCTGYEKPVQAVLRAAAVLRGEQVAEPEYLTSSVAGDQLEPDEQSTSVLSAVSAHVTREQGSSGTAVSTKKGSEDTTSRTEENKVQGKSIPVLQASSMVQGKTLFTADVQMRGTLYARILGSPHAAATIRSIDISRAKALPGVHAVLTYRDVPRIVFSSVEQMGMETPVEDQYSLDYSVRYAGQPVAIVAAESAEVADQALQLIDVHYEVLSAISDVRQALNPQAPRVHTEGESRGIYDATRNIAARVRSDVGDVEGGFASTDLVIENEYVLAPTQPAPLETHTVLTYLDEDEQLVVRATSQIPQHIQRTLAKVLNLPARRIHVITPHLGGSFGLRQELCGEDLCARLTLLTKRPVLLHLSRAEEFGRRGRTQHILRIKSGVKGDGTLVANQIILLADTGAYATHALVTHPFSLAHALSLYPCEHMRFVAEVLYTNLPPAAAFAESSLLQEFFALESHMDEIARRLNINEMELRRKNWISSGTPYPFPTSVGRAEFAAFVTNNALSECTRIVMEQVFDKQQREPEQKDRIRHGRGTALALSGYPTSQQVSSNTVIKLNEEGSFDIFVGLHDEGRGFATIIAQTAADVLGVSLDEVRLHTSETNTVPSSTGGENALMHSASTNAVVRAAERMREQIVETAARMLRISSEDLRLVNGDVQTSDGQKVTVAQVAAHALYKEQHQLLATASQRVQSLPAAVAASGAEVEVDMETGAVRVLRLVVAAETGNLSNPMLTEGWIEGGVAQGLGIALSEELLYDAKGILQTTSFQNYHIPVAADIPEIQVHQVGMNERGELTPKAAAVATMYTVAPAIANAVTDALGARVKRLPLTPERVLGVIHAQAQAKSQPQTQVQEVKNK